MSLRLEKPMTAKHVQSMVHKREQAFIQLSGKKPTEAQRQVMKKQVHDVAKKLEATR